MEAYNLIQDIFIEEKEEEIQKDQQPYIDILVNILKKCQVLKRNEEAEAIPYLDIICAFIERLLEKEDFILYMTRFPKIKDHLMDVLFPGLAKIILTVSFMDINFFIVFLFLVLCTSIIFCRWSSLQSDHPRDVTSNIFGCSMD